MRSRDGTGGRGVQVHSLLISLVRSSTIASGATREHFSDSASTRLLWVGRADPEKRPELLLASFRDLCDRRQEPLELDVVGCGPLLGELKELASSLRIEDRVRFHGYVPFGARLRQFYEAADVLIHSSSSEGFSASDSGGNGHPSPGRDDGRWRHTNATGERFERDPRSVWGRGGACQWSGKSAR